MVALCCSIPPSHDPRSPSLSAALCVRACCLSFGGIQLPCRLTDKGGHAGADDHVQHGDADGQVWIVADHAHATFMLKHGIDTVDGMLYGGVG